MSNCVFMSRVWVLSNQTRRRGETSKTKKKVNSDARCERDTLQA